MGEDDISSLVSVTLSSHFSMLLLNVYAKKTCLKLRKE